MPRTFNGTSDEIRVSLGAMPTTHPMSVAAFMKIAPAGDGVVFSVMTGHDGSQNGAWDFQHHSSDTWVFEFVNSGFAFSTTATTSADGWCLIIVTKATGTTAPRFHRYKVSTNTWVHENMGTAFGGVTRTATSMRFANYQGGAWAPMDMEWAGIWARALSDAEVEELAFSLIDVHASTPSALWKLDQSATGQNLADLTGGGANQSSIAGTSVAAASAPLFNWGDGAWFVVRPQGAASQSISATGIASEERAGTIASTPGVVTLAPTGITTSENRGATSVGLNIAPAAIPTSENAGSAAVGFQLAPVGIPSGEAAGQTTATPGVATVAATGIASGEAIGDVQVSTIATQTIAPAGIESSEGHGPASLTPGAVTIAVVGVPSGESFGVPILSVFLTPRGIESGEQHGTTVVAPGGLGIGPAGLPSTEVFGTATITAGAVIVTPAGIPPSEAMGGASVGRQLATVGIPSDERFGALAVSIGTPVLTLVGLETGERMGVVTVGGGTGFAAATLVVAGRTRAMAASARTRILVAVER